MMADAHTPRKTGTGPPPRAEAGGADTAPETERRGEEAAGERTEDTEGRSQDEPKGDDSAWRVGGQGCSWENSFDNSLFTTVLACVDN